MKCKNFNHEMCFSDFWIEKTQTYPYLTKMALKVFIPFATTCKCETAFSTLSNPNSKTVRTLLTV